MLDLKGEACLHLGILLQGLLSFKKTPHCLQILIAMMMTNFFRYLKAFLLRNRRRFSIFMIPALKLKKVF